MSYILEALKKAEAERNGAVHTGAPLLPPFASSSRHPPPWRRPRPWAGLAALAVTLACAAWFAVSRTDIAPTPAKVPVQSRTAPDIAPPPIATPRMEVTAPLAAAPVQEEPKARPTPKKAAEKKQRPSQAENTKAAKATQQEPPVGTLRDLPAQIQGEIPPLSIGGYIYSGNKADRSVLINKRLLREGDEVAPGLILEKMMPSGMVLNYKGYRYRRGY